MFGQFHLIQRVVCIILLAWSSLNTILWPQGIQKIKTNTYIKLILDSWYDLIAPKEINKPS